ncbi:MAG: hypothetical protein OXN83_03140 [Oligoflexia bacterium]|nr:hypothetical protein [Oligoflexia bacterium]
MYKGKTGFTNGGGGGYKMVFQVIRDSQNYYINQEKALDDNGLSCILIPKNF